MGSSAGASAETEAARKLIRALARKWLGAKLTPSEERIIAYGYTAATCGQRINLRRLNDGA